MQWSDSGSDGDYLGNDTNKTRLQQKLKKKILKILKVLKIQTYQK